MRTLPPSLPPPMMLPLASTVALPLPPPRVPERVPEPFRVSEGNSEARYSMTRARAWALALAAVTPARRRPQTSGSQLVPSDSR